MAGRGGAGRGCIVGGGDGEVEGAEVGKMTAEPSVRHVLSSWEGLCFRSVSSASHACYREIVTRPVPECSFVRVR